MHISLVAYLLLLLRYGDLERDLDLDLEYDLGINDHIISKSLSTADNDKDPTSSSSGEVS